MLTPSHGGPKRTVAGETVRFQTLKHLGAGGCPE